MGMKAPGGRAWGGKEENVLLKVLNVPEHLWPGSVTDWLGMGGWWGMLGGCGEVYFQMN